MSETAEPPLPTLRHALLLSVLDNSIVVRNEGSMARDQFANERTWLSWTKLSCTLIVLGFTIIMNLRLPSGHSGQPTMDERYTKPIGVTFVAIGLVAFICGLIKYFKNLKLLIQHRTLVQAGWVSFLLMGIVSIFTCTIMLIIISNHLG